MNRRPNPWLPSWLPAALASRGVVVEKFGRGDAAPEQLADRWRVWTGHYWHVERRRGASRYVVGDMHGPFQSASAAADHARLTLGLTERDAERWSYASEERRARA